MLPQLLDQAKLPIPEELLAALRCQGIHPPGCWIVSGIRFDGSSKELKACTSAKEIEEFLDYYEAGDNAPWGPGPEFKSYTIHWRP